MSPTKSSIQPPRWRRPSAASVILVHVEEPEPQFVGYDPGPLSVRVAVAGDIQANLRRLEALKGKFARRKIRWP